MISLLLKDSQESSPAPQFESNNSLALILLYGPTLISKYFLEGSYCIITKISVLRGLDFTLTFKRLSFNVSPLCNLLVVLKQATEILAQSFFQMWIVVLVPP